jgi:hypothetical protein
MTCRMYSVGLIHLFFVALSNRSVHSLHSLLLSGGLSSLCLLNARTPAGTLIVYQICQTTSVRFKNFTQSELQNACCIYCLMCATDIWYISLCLRWLIGTSKPGPSCKWVVLLSRCKYCKFLFIGCEAFTWEIKSFESCCNCANENLWLIVVPYSLAKSANILNRMNDLMSAL